MTMDYLITVFGDFSESKNVDEVTTSLRPLIDSENLTFNYNEHSLIVHFSADMSLQVLSNYVKDVLYLKADMVLISPSDVTSILANEEFMNKLLKHQTSNDVSDVSLEFVDSKPFERLHEEMMSLDEDDDEEDEIKTIIQRAKKKTLSLDDLLDKITEKGIDSLTNKEKKLLQNLSK
jgi:hypothetical protein